MCFLYLISSILVLWMQYSEELKTDIQERNTTLVCSEFSLLSHALQVYREDSIFVGLSKLCRKRGKDMMLLAIIMVAAIMGSILVFGCIIQRNDYSEKEEEYESE